MYITHVKKDNNKVITLVRVYKSWGACGSSQHEDRTPESIIKDLDLGLNFYTCYYENGAWIRGQPVRSINGHLRSIGNILTKDNLDNLPPIK